MQEMAGLLKNASPENRANTGFISFQLIEFDAY